MDWWWNLTPGKFIMESIWRRGGWRPVYRSNSNNRWRICGRRHDQEARIHSAMPGWSDRRERERYLVEEVPGYPQPGYIYGVTQTSDGFAFAEYFLSPAQRNGWLWKQMDQVIYNGKENRNFQHWRSRGIVEDNHERLVVTATISAALIRWSIDQIRSFPPEM